MEPYLLAAALVAYNGLANLWPPFHGRAYVPMNAVATAIVAAIGLGPLALSGNQIGFGGDWASDLGLGLIIGTALAAPVLTVASVPRWSRLVADERMRGIAGGALVYRTLVRIPIGTALLEELAFRGVLYAAWREDGVAAAVIGSSVAFGLWHITPAREMLRANRPDSSTARVAVWIAGTIAATGAAGAGFAVLREATDGIAAPFVLHAAFNSLTSVAAAIAHRRTSTTI